MSYIATEYFNAGLSNFKNTELARLKALKLCRCPRHPIAGELQLTEKEYPAYHGQKIISFKSALCPNECGHLFTHYYLVKGDNYTYHGTEITKNSPTIIKKTIGMIMSDLTLNFKQPQALINIFSNVTQEDTEILPKLFQIAFPIIEERKSLPQGYKLTFTSNPKNIVDFVFALISAQVQGVECNLEASTVKFRVGGVPTQTPSYMAGTV